MAEPFGVVAGAVGIAAAFSSCIDCFDYVQQARYFGRDFQTNFLTLDFLSGDVQHTKEIFGHILELFAKTNELSKNYKRNAKTDDDLSVYQIGDLDAAVLALHRKLKDRASGRQKTTGTLKTTSWAIYSKKEYTELVDGILVLIDNLEKIYPPPQQQQQQGCLLEEDLRIVDEADRSVDSSIKSAAKAVLGGHRYANVDIQGKAQTGDSFAPGWQGQRAGGSHTFDSIVVGPNAKEQLGNTFGQKGFWDN